jgi:hypothetical protein
MEESSSMLSAGSYLVSIERIAVSIERIAVVVGRGIAKTTTNGRWGVVQDNW